MACEASLYHDSSPRTRCHRPRARHPLVDSVHISEGSRARATGGGAAPGGLGRIPFHRARRASLPAGGPGCRRPRGLGALRRGLLRTGLVSQRDRRSAPARRDRVRHGPAVAAIATGKDRAPRARGTARLGLSLHGLGGLSGERARGREQVPSGRSARVGAVPASVDTEGGTRAPRGVVARRGRGLRDQPGGCRQRHGAGRSVSSRLAIWIRSATPMPPRPFAAMASLPALLLACRKSTPAVLRVAAACRCRVPVAIRTFSSESWGPYRSGRCAALPPRGRARTGCAWSWEWAWWRGVSAISIGPIYHVYDVGIDLSNAGLPPSERRGGRPRRCGARYIAPRHRVRRRRGRSARCSRRTAAAEHPNRSRTARRGVSAVVVAAVVAAQPLP